MDNLINNINLSFEDISEALTVLSHRIDTLTARMNLLLGVKMNVFSEEQLNDLIVRGRQAQLNYISFTLPGPELNNNLYIMRKYNLEIAGREIKCPDRQIFFTLRKYLEEK